MAEKIIGYVIHQRGQEIKNDETCSRERAEQVAEVWRELTGPIVAQRIIKRRGGEIIYEDME